MNLAKYGGLWEGWPHRIIESWNHVVSDDDVVMVGGDNSWPNAAFHPTYHRMSALPGHKLFIDGNHCKQIHKEIGSKGVLTFTKEMEDKYNMHYLHDFVRYNNTGIIGQKLFDLPTHTFHSRYEGREGYFKNELEHLKNRIDLYETEMLQCEKRVFLSHYPVVDNHMDFDGSAWLKEILRVNPTHICFGHLHGATVREFMPKSDFEWKGIKFTHSTPDLNDFQVKLIIEEM